MNDRMGVADSGASSVILFPLLFDIIGYLKGYAGGLVVQSTDDLHIGLVGDFPDDPGVSFTVCRFTRVNRQAEMILPLLEGQMCKVFLSGIRAFCAFQLESLILAQNERWRQA